MPLTAPEESTSEIPEMRSETRFPAVVFPLVGAAVSSSMAVRAGDTAVSRVGASLTALTVMETVSVLEEKAVVVPFVVVSTLEPAEPDV